MKLLHVSDLHFRLPWFDWVADQALNYDAVCLSGDLLDIFSKTNTSLRAQCKWMRAWLKAFPGRIYVCSGNHDWWMPHEHYIDTDVQGGWLRKTASSTVHVDGTSEIFHGFRFTCCPWLRVPKSSGLEAAVVLVHTPPQAEPLSSKLGRKSGDPEVAAAILKLPEGSLVLSGHIHDPKQWCHKLGSAWCFNPGVNFDATVPNHITIDTTIGEAEFHGVNHTQKVSGLTSEVGRS